METSITKFEAKTIRNEVVKQMEAMQNEKFVKLPENYKESAFFALEKMASLPDIEKVPAIGITKALIGMFSNNLDFRKNHCYFFVQNDKNTGKSLRFGWQYQGLISVAKSQCNVHEVIPVLVYEDDTFKTHYQDGALIIDEHTSTFEGKIKGGYCVVDFQDKRRGAMESSKPKLFTCIPRNKRFCKHRGGKFKKRIQKRITNTCILRHL